MSSNKLTIKKIFIASPGDLISERDSFKNIIHEVNTNHAHKIGFHLEVLGWETTQPGKGRPQELINKLLLETDLFIMLMWRRWGTPSGKFSSGTEEEYHVAKNLNVESNKPEMWLFFKKIDSIDESNIDDCKKVIEFRKQIELSKEFFFKSFSTIEEWEEQIRNSLYNWFDNISAEVEKEIVEIQEVLPTINNILIEITYLDRYQGNSKDEIYFTITDEQSFGAWKVLTEEEKKELLYYYLSKYLYLNLGVTKYKAVMRYKLQDHNYLVLGLITFSYGQTIENSKFYFPPDYHQIITSIEKENTILDLHANF